MKSVVIGASPNPDRYAHMATERLVGHGHEVIAVGNRDGEIAGVEIQTDLPNVDDVDTVTLYVGPQNQTEEIKAYIIGLQPKRVIFNPGTENPAFMSLLQEKGISVVSGCTLVMLSIGNY